VEFKKFSFGLWGFNITKPNEKGMLIEGSAQPCEKDRSAALMKLHSVLPQHAKANK